MKKDEQNRSISLRKKGYSVGEIAHTLGVSKGSVSNWVKDIKLSVHQQKYLELKYKGTQAVEKRRLTRLNNEQRKRDEVSNTAKSEVHNLLSNKLFLIGVMLYYAEGGKSQRGLVRFSNSDPKMIKLMMRFFREICRVPEQKFKGHIHTHSDKQIKPSELFWSEITGIPKSAFFKTYVPSKDKISVSRKTTRILKHGTFDIYVCDTNLFLKIKGWIEGVCDIYLL